MSKWILSLLAVVLIWVAGCGNIPTPEPTSVPTEIPSETPLPTLTATPSPVPTATGKRTWALEPTPEPTLPAVPEGMQVEGLDPVQYGVRLVAPGVNIRKEPNTGAEAIAKLECGAAPLTLDATASGGADGKLW